MARHRSPSTLFTRSSKWKATKKAMFAVKLCCCTCGSASDLTVHHIIPRSERPDLSYDPDNLAVLCRSCHDEVHNIIRKGSKEN